jgi:hypothetical protein
MTGETMTSWTKFAFGDLVVNRNVGSKTTSRQLAEMFRLSAQYQMKPSEYSLYEFHRNDRDIERIATNYISTYWLNHRYLPVLSDPRLNNALGDKWLFDRVYGNGRIPVPRTYAMFSRGRGVTSCGRPLRDRASLLDHLSSVPATSLVVKPAGGSGGRGVMILDDIEWSHRHMEATDVTGKRIDFDLLADHIDDGPPHKGIDGYIIQERLSQHPELTRMAPFTVNTVRVVTFVDATESPSVDVAVLRLGRKGRTADNWAQGGVSVGIDPRSGLLGYGRTKPAYGSEWREDHPDSGERFTGRTVPLWGEVVELCEQAAMVLPGLRWVGWDVVVTPSGPRIIEGNYTWDLPMMQVHTGGLHTEERVRRLRDLGVEVPTQLPHPSLDHLRYWVKKRRGKPTAV